MKILLSFITLLLLHNTAMCEKPIAIAFYDVGKLYDTIPSNFYNDKTYTPKGKNRWNSERYNLKIKNIVSVIDSIKMPILVLAGVENEEVVRDIVQRTEQDFTYLHRTTDYYDGLDFALLYYGDLLFVDHVSATAHTTTISAEIHNQTISLHLARVGAKFRNTIPPDSDKPTDITIAWGRLTHSDLQRLHMNDMVRDSEKSGRGDTKGDYGWLFKNRIGLSTTKRLSTKCGVYIAKQLLTDDMSAPLATFKNDRYLGGYSNHLPIYLYINTEPKDGN